MATQPPTLQTAPDRVESTDAEAAAAARAVVALFARWAIDDADARRLLGGMAARTWASWKAGRIGPVDRDLATRLSLLLGIHRALRYIFGHNTARAYAWVAAPNGAFDGQSALAVMRGGRTADLDRVRAYLDAGRGG